MGLAASRWVLHSAQDDGGLGVGWADTGSALTIVTPSTFLGAGFVSDLADSPSDARTVGEGLLFVAAAGGVVSCSILPGEGLNPN